MPDNNQQNPYILWDMSCNPMPTPCGGVGAQNQTTCAETQTWFWLALTAIVAFGFLGGGR